MESTSRNLGKDGGEEDNATEFAIESLESKGDNLVPKRYRRISEHNRTLILSIRRSRASASCRELFLHNFHGSYNSIPKHITTVDEKYVLRCLELIRNCALRAASWNFTSKLDILSDHPSSLAKIKNTSSDNMAIEYPLDGATEVIVNSTGGWTIGTVSGSQTMINILKSPLLQQFGSFDDMSEPFSSDFTGSVQEPTSTLSCKPEKDVKVLDSKYLSPPLHRRETSISSSNSSFSDQSSSSTYGNSFQGMLQCTWKGGLPRHVFTVDDKREVYVANLSKVETSYRKDLDYYYTFHLKRNGKKETEVTDVELETVAKMRVSTSITFSSNNSEVRETRFVLSFSSENRTGDVKASNQAHKKNKKLTRKVVDVFRPGHSHKQRSTSSFEGSSAISVDTPLDLSDNSFLDLDESFEENTYAPNLELAAIVVKDISNNRKEVELGGWGLKFLKRSGNASSLDATIPSESSRNTGECSTSMDILIPAGFHGGPRAKVGGPSTLIERWMSGGQCDCGGWDTGCPLKVLNTRSTATDHSSKLEKSGECKSVDLFMQGSKQNTPIMKMVNIHKGLYYINFQSTLSTLQSFAIAAAILHSRSPILRSKVYRS